MKTITIELLNEKAINLIKQLEQLNILRITIDSTSQKRKISSHQWVGSLSKDTAKLMLASVDQSRNE